MILYGLVLGSVGAIFATRVLAHLLFEIDPLDPLTFVAAPLLLAGVGLFACYLPARAATRVDPVVTLRHE